MIQIKGYLKNTARALGIYLASIERLGIDLELDLARLTKGDPLMTIFDIGGNFGQTTCRFASAFPDATIFTFEPVPTSFERLLKATKDKTRVKAFNIALGDSSGIVQMNLTHDAALNSIMNVQSSQSKVEVQIERLDKIANNCDITMIDLLKIDVEGYEPKVLEGAEQFLKEGRIRFVYAECIFSPNAEMPHMSFFDLNQVLEKAGFCFVNYYAESFNLRLGCAQGNVLYALRSKLPKHIQGHVKNIS